MLALEDLFGDWWFYSKDNQHIEACLMMLSFGVSRCAGHIDKPKWKTHEINACGIGTCNVLEAFRSGGPGDLRFTMNSEQQQSQVLLCVEVGFVTDFESKRCDDLRALFCLEIFGGCVIVRISYMQLSICVGDKQQTLKPFVWQ